MTYDQYERLVADGGVYDPANPRVTGLKRLRSPQELAEAAATLRRNGYTKCDACSTWHNESQRAMMHGSARDSRCPSCGHLNRA